MKYLIPLIAIIFCSTQLTAQTSKFDTLISVSWNGSSWQNHSRTINNYDANCILNNSLVQNWDALTGNWIDYSFTTYTYIADKFKSEVLTKIWSNNSWTNNYKENYTYDVSYKTLSIVGQNWSSDHWSNYVSTSNTYDAYGYPDSVLVQLSYADNPFENSTLTITSNNSTGKPLQTIKQKWNKLTKSWDNDSKYSFIYNDGEMIDTAITAVWNYNNALWQLQTQTINTYTTTGKLFYSILQGWQTSQWVNQLLYTNYYDSNSFVSNILVQQWDGFDFENYTQTIYQNNSDGSIYKHATQVWDEAANTWVNNLQETYFYPASCRLPLELLLFTATKNNTTVNVNWQTRNEKDVSHFTIQRKTTDPDFTNLDNIAAQNGSAINSYEYADNIGNISADKIYYRLQIINNDGSCTYSNPVFVTLSENTKLFKVYPNPAKDELFISFNTQSTSKPELRITDISGKIIYHNTINNQGSNVVSVNVASLSTGMYFIMLINGTEIQKATFIKQ